MAGNFCGKLRLPRIHFRVLLHAANMPHGTNGFTSLPKEGVLRIFSPWKIRRLRPGLNPRTWVPKASTLKPSVNFIFYCWLVSININYYGVMSISMNPGVTHSLTFMVLWRIRCVWQTFCLLILNEYSYIVLRESTARLPVCKSLW